MSASDQCHRPAGSNEGYLFVVSAADGERLLAYVAKVADWLAAPGDRPDLADAIVTWQVARTAMRHRLAVRVQDRAELVAKLRDWLERGDAATGVRTGEADPGDAGNELAWQGEAGRERLEAAMAARDWDRIAEFWVTGATIKWHSLHEGSQRKPRRVSLPTYPFARERHWVDDGETGIQEVAPVLTQPAARHVLVSPAWEPAPLADADDASRAAAIERHCILLAGLDDIEAASLAALLPASECAHLAGAASGDIGERYAADAQECLARIQTLLAEQPRRTVLFQVVGARADARLAAGLSGLLKTAGEEHPNFRGQVVLTEARSPDALAAQLRAEKGRADDPMVSYTGGERRVPRWRPVRTQPSGPSFRKDGVYLITGGLGKLGVLFAEDILRTAPGARVVLTGRTAPCTQRQQVLDRLSLESAARGGPAVLYRTLDLQRRDAVEGLVADLLREHGRLDGILHCAGMTADKLIVHKSSAEFAGVLAPKVAGTVHLDAASRQAALDFFVLFSSAAGAFGHSGQGDYAAANGFLDEFSAWRNALVERGERAGRTLAIAWPIWQDGGMAIDPAGLEHLRRTTGLVSMRSATGLQAFHDSLASVCSRTMVLEGEIDGINALLERGTATARQPLVRKSAGTIDAARIAEETLNRLRQLFSEVTRRPVARIDSRAELASYGVDSIIISHMNAGLAAAFGELPKTLFFEHRTLAAVAGHLVREYPGECAAWAGMQEPAPSKPPIPVRAVRQQVTGAAVVAAAERSRDEPIAIIGISGIYPEAADLDAFWANLQAGRNSIREIPAERWSLDGFYVADPDAAVEQGRSYCKWGGFIDGFADFDPIFFNISPHEAMRIDPQERLFLQEAWRAMESAGHTRADLKERYGQRVGVFAGITKAGFNLHATPSSGEGPPFFPYTSFGSTANRVSYFLDIAGPSMPVDTMCSSALTAIHEACEHIRRGECDLAFAGGVNLYLHPSTYTMLCSHRMLSREGRCRSFGAGGSGYVPGEGVGVVLLKPLSSAIRDGDPVHGVILATHVNHGGRTNGYTVPNPRAQADLIRCAIDKAGIQATDIGYIEAHGTGTELGDPIEIAGLQQAFAPDHPGPGTCRIGSAKSNIGHLEAAAGIAGLTKVLLQMKHGQIVPSLHATRLNPNIAFDRSAFRVNTELSPWEPARSSSGEPLPRIAGISSFGAAGANAHVIVQEYVAPAGEAGATLPDGEFLVPLSARTGEQLKQRARDLLRFIAAAPTVDLQALAYTLQVGREPMEQRLGCIVRTVAQLADKLQAYVDGQVEIEGVHQGGAAQTSEALQAFADDEDFREAIARWMDRRKLARLADLWCRGVTLDWNRLYGEARPRRLALPTYPFARERLWVDAIVQPSHGTTPAAAAAALHPLVHANTSDFRRQQYTSVFTGDEFFLRDHQVNGGRILPAVAYLEMTRAAIALAEPEGAEDAVLELHDTTWAQPIVVANATQVGIALVPDDAGGAIAFEIRSGPTVHCQGHALHARAQRVAALDLAGIAAAMTRGALDVAGLYDDYRAMGVNFGAAHRALAEVRLGDGQLLARLRLPASVASGAQAYLLHPSLLDGALQASIALADASLRRPDRPLLPFSLDMLRVLAPCSGEMLAWVRRSGEPGRGGALLKFDIDLCDAQGHVCVQMRGFSSRPLEGEGAPAVHALIPVWSRVAPPVRQAPERGSTRVLVAGGGSRALEWVQRSFPAAQALPWQPGADVAELGKQLADSAFDHLLWIAPDVFGGEVARDDLVAAQEHGVLAVFRLAKALLDAGHADRALRWTLVTRGTQRVKPHECTAPAHAAVAGLVGSMAKEYPQWELALLDVDDPASLSADECLASPADPRGDGMAHRGGEWFRQGLARCTGLPEPAPAYRQGGVYVVVGGAGGIGGAWSRFMVEHYDARLVWIGRRPLDGAVEEKMRALGSIGRAPVYFQADASDAQALREVRRQILALHPAIHGVVHSAIALQDQGLAAMDERTFRSSVSAKVDVSVALEQVFGDDDLDGMLFFSSLISFTRGAGQSNYAAGCTFKDSFAHSVAQRRPYPVRIMNWGYWGEVGVVTQAFYRKRMQQLGIGSIEAPEGMAALQALVGSRLPQMALIKTLDERALDDIAVPECVALPATRPACSLPHALADFRQRFAAGDPETLQRDLLAPQAIELAGGILASVLAALEPEGQAPLAAHERWLRTSRAYVRERNCQVWPLAAAWAEWEANKPAWVGNPKVRAQVALLEACLKALPDMLAGRRAATDVMFPNSSMHLVEGVYQGHALADHSNDALGAALACSIRQLRRAGRGDAIRILEIGAGTGGTTTRLLPVLREFEAGIAEYCYTDLSRAFLLHAETQFRPQVPALATAIFDVAKPLQGQAVDLQRYDFVIATNVLHATTDIREALRNAKALLKAGGVLLLNEMSAWTLFSHLTFGLLEGWWLYEDAALRLPGSPGLAPASWKRVLEEEGFEAVSFVAEEAHALGQQVIAAESDGVVRQRILARAAVPAPAAKPEERPVPAAAVTTPAAPDGSLRERCIAHLQGVVAGTLRMEAAQVGPHRALADYGLDSILVVGLTNQLRKTFPGITSTLFFEAQNIAAIVDYLLEHKKEHVVALFGGGAPASAQLPPPPPAAGIPADRRTRFSRQGPAAAPAAGSVFDVAIVGLSGRYPQAPDLDTFWRNLSGGRNCVGEIPRERWDWSAWHDAEKGKPGRISTKWGGFLEDIDKFDPLFFRISPKEAKAMDPQERLFLQSCYHAIEDAGYTPDTLGEIGRIGVFVGVMNARYTTQPLYYSIANRVSFALNFQGPSMAVDSACSSSLTALHVALESLYSGSSTCAIAGGVNLIIDPAHYLELSAFKMLSSDDCCRSFGAGADGFVDAEGVGAVVLKPLRDAERDGDHIYGVIKGSAVNAGGRTNGYTVPNPLAQAAVVSTALRRARVDASHVSYVEAHGTGTALGDPIEIAGLTRAFEPFTRARQFCAIGSLKSNIGHCESAAGIAALTKVLLQFRHRQIAPSLHAEVTNPEIHFSQTPFRLQQRLVEWARPRCEVDGTVREIPRIAGISSFGAGGANAHLVVQEHEGRARGNVGVRGAQAAVVLSARTEGQLRQKVADLLQFLRATAGGAASLDLPALAWTLQVGREAMEERLGLVVSSIAELEHGLAAWLQGRQLGPVHRGRVKRQQEAEEGHATQAHGPAAGDPDASAMVAAWARGARVDWTTLYEGARPGRISLPLYPFARERYWRNPAGLRPGGAKQAVQEALHPLLHRNVSSLHQQRYATSLGEGDGYMADHCVVDEAGVARSLVPAAVVLEMARAAIEDATAPSPERQRATWELFDIAWGDPIEAGGKRQLFVALLAERGDQAGFEIYGEAQDGSEEVVHCQGHACPRTDLQQVTIDLARIKSHMRAPALDAATHYAALAQRRGVHYGASYRGITALYRGDGQVLAEMVLPLPATEDATAASERWVLHPAMLDCALQAAGELLSPAARPSLPLALESLRVLRACTTEMVAWVRPALGSSAEGDDVRIDIDLCDAQGRACVQMRGLTYERQAATPTGSPHGEAGIVLEPAQPSDFGSRAGTGPLQISLDTDA